MAGRSLPTPKFESMQFIPTHNVAYDSLKSHLQKFKTSLRLAKQLKEACDTK